MAKKATIVSQVRIDRDVRPMLRKAMKRNSRSASGEVNHVLRGVYRTAVEVVIPNAGQPNVILDKKAFEHFRKVF